MKKDGSHDVGYWSLEKLMEEGKKYHTRGEFKKHSPSAYATALRKGLIDSMTWFENGRCKKRGQYKEHKYSIDIIAAIIKDHNCSNVTDLRKVNEYAYKQARDNNWLTDLCLAENKHEDGFWTPERVWDVAKKYTNKDDFRKNEPVARTWASKYGLLDKMSWMRCPTYNERRDNHVSEVYAFIDEKKKVAYIGLSIDTNQRKKAHKSDRKSAVKKYFGKNVPEPIVLMSQLTIDESTYWEDYYKKKYSNEGYTLLNIAATGLGTGSIGGISKWYSKETVFEESLKYHSRTEFKRKSGGAYNHALSNGWLDEMYWLETPPRAIKWTKEKVIEESRKYHYKGEFCNGSPCAYNVAKEEGWLEEMIWIKEKRKPTNYWTRERVFEESRKYNNRKDFNANAKTACILATQNGWIKDMTWLKPLPLGHISEWTREKIIEESKKYTSKSEFAEKSQTAYHHACKDKTLFMEMPWLVEKKKPNGWWNDKEKVMKEGKKYHSRTAFANGSYSAWKSAKKNGWIDEMTWLENKSNNNSNH